MKATTKHIQDQGGNCNSDEKKGNMKVGYLNFFFFYN